jgi:hypothetical protein
MSARDHAEGKEWYVGRHVVRFHPPDRHHFIVNGDIAPQHANEYLEITAELGERHGDLWATGDLRSMGVLSHGARIAFTRVGRRYPFHALAYLNAPFSVRVIFQMLITGGRRLAPEHFHFPVRFVDTEEAARAWFDCLREHPSRTG